MGGGHFPNRCSLNKLYKLLYFSYIGPFAATFFIALFVLVVQFLFKWVDELIGKGLPAEVLFQLVFYATVGLVAMALPLAVLLSSIMLFGSLAEHRELMALKSAGVSLVRVLVVMFPLLMVMMGMTFLLNNYFIPHANRKLGVLLIDIRQQKPAIEIPEGIFYSGLRDYSIRVGKKHGDGRLDDLIIYDHSERRGNTKVLLADSGRFYYSADTNWLFFEVYDGILYDEALQSGSPLQTPPFLATWFRRYRIKVDIREFKFSRSDESLLGNHYQAMPLSELAAHADSIMDQYHHRLDDFRNSFQPFFLFMRDSLFWEWSAANSSSPVFRLPSSPSSIQRALNEAYSIQNITRAYVSELRHYLKMRARYLAEWHRKFTLTLAVLILFLIGASTGAIIRKGGLGMPIVVSVLLFIAFYLIDMTGYKMVKELLVQPWVGIWLPIFVLLPVAVLLVTVANRDLNLLAWYHWRPWRHITQRFQIGF